MNNFENALKEKCKKMNDNEPYYVTPEFTWQAGARWAREWCEQNIERVYVYSKKEMKEEIDKLKSERARLREALQFINDYVESEDADIIQYHCTEALQNEVDHD